MINRFWSHPVDVVGNVGHFVLESLSLSDGEHEVLGLLIGEGKTLDELPMVEDALRESLSLGVSSEHAGEAEGFGDGQESFNLS